jgi:uncharacterized protein
VKDFPADRSRFLRAPWITAGLLALILIPLLRGVPSFISDYLWFGEVGFRQVFITTLWAQIGLQVAFGGAFLLFLLGNLFIAFRRVTPNFRVLHELKAFLPGVEEIYPRFRFIAVAAALFLTLLVGQWAAGQWLAWLRFQNAESFGVAEPVFARDFSFYVFVLPFLRSLAGFVQFTLFAATITTAAAYFLQGQLWVWPGFAGVSRRARRHLLILLAGILAMAAVQTFLGRYDLLHSTRGLVTGAGYTDLHATLPALYIAASVSMLAAAALAYEAFGRSVRLSLISIAAVVLVHLVLVQLWPMALQRLVVAPNEIERERPYIVRAIAATRYAFALDDVEEGQFPASENLTSARVSANAATIDNVRLWESEPLKTTNGQLQEIRTYYDFVDVDNDRYLIGGKLRQVALSPRELNPAGLPARIWINEHLTYTHGYGVCVAPVNRITSEGLPEYIVKDIPPVSSVPELEIRRPEIYYGELAAEYVIVGTRALEFDYPAGEENVYTKYRGRGGIRLDDLGSRLLFALRFGEPKILLSTDFTDSSRILLHRRVSERVSKVAPFLVWEKDPYIIIRSDGTLTWMIDGYTTTDRIPYSARVDGVGNYIRNPIKATVDAYNGDVRLWAVDAKDPLLRSLARIFPAAFTPLDSMPSDLRAHMRYPEGMFSVQSQVYGTYHMTDPQVFYNKEDLWKVAQRDVGSGRGGAVVSPYFTVMKLAGAGAKEEFILMLPFTPSLKENMIAWMSARSDPPHYGKLLVYSFPKQRLVYGPQQIESRINQDTEISRDLTLWNQQGSQVIRGNLLVVPVDSSIVYFQPLYLQASSQAGLPELKRILVSFGNRIVMEPTMDAALARIFSVGGRDHREPVAASRLPGSTTEAGAAPVGGGTAPAERLRRAAEIYGRAQQALRRGDLQEYAREMEALGRVLEER